jgi:hypothetical protein
MVGLERKTCICLPKIVELKKLMVPSEKAPRELSNEWSYQYVSPTSNRHLLQAKAEFIQDSEILFKKEIFIFSALNEILSTLNDILYRLT